MAKGRCRARIEDNRSMERCEREAGHHKSKVQADAIHVSPNGVSWYEGDEGITWVPVPDEED